MELAQDRGEGVWWGGERPQGPGVQAWEQHPTVLPRGRAWVVTGCPLSRPPREVPGGGASGGGRRLAHDGGAHDGKDLSHLHAGAPISDL